MSGFLVDAIESDDALNPAKNPNSSTDSPTAAPAAPSSTETNVCYHLILSFLSLNYIVMVIAIVTALY